MLKLGKKTEELKSTLNEFKSEAADIFKELKIGYAATLTGASLSIGFVCGVAVTLCVTVFGKRR